MPLEEFEEFDSQLIQQDAWQELSDEEHEFANSDGLVFEALTGDMHSVIVKQVEETKVESQDPHVDKYHNKEVKDVIFSIGIEGNVEKT